MRDRDDTPRWRLPFARIEDDMGLEMMDVKNPVQSKAPQGSRASTHRRVRLLWSVASLAIAALVIYASSTSALTFLGSQLIHSDPLERVDAMIVLASGLDRIVEAAELYRG